MYWKNFMIQRKKSKILIINKSLKYIKQRCLISLSVEKIQKVKLLTSNGPDWI